VEEKEEEEKRKNLVNEELSSLFSAFEILGVRQWGCSHVEAVLDGSIPAVELCSVEEAKAFA